MSKKLPFEPKVVTFACTACNKKFEILSAHTEDTINIDICSNCHPFYLGQTNLSRTIGAVEKLKSKFEAGKNYIKKRV
ncbi:50S ribosomal protein L31 [Candidatus Mycoplasma haematobovis]|uniref:50S ribosomal protein L31 n=1 Tax=Candidatus Mycoplasma haematobovis TaxID=432608 RepID=A0A1A9QCZ7_9MOLU|nr:50S ribosomal protein L31 [Candidatus Mycoplasma haematobovis]OAL10347.1 50S ribosomal protein L31 [Candidatus Mycoplasma haematobovis]